MKITYKILALLCLLFTVASCGDNNSKTRGYAAPEFLAETDQAFSIIKEDAFIANMIFDMDVCGDYLILIYFRDNKWIHIYDKTTGVFIRSLINKGRGPLESISPSEISVNQTTGDIYKFDYSSKKMLSFNIKDIGETIVPIKKIEGDFKGYNFVYTIDNKTTITDSHHDMKTRYSLLQDNILKSAYYDYPVDDKDLAFHLYTDYKLSISPDNTKMVAGTLTGAILEGFNIKDTIEQKWVNYYVEPKLDETGKSLDYETCGLGFVDIYATNDLIYTSYDGNRRMGIYKDLAIFDWKGTPLKIIRTPRNILKICYDQQSETLYGLLMEDEKFSFGKIKID